MQENCRVVPIFRLPDILPRSDHHKKLYVRLYPYRTNLYNVHNILNKSYLKLARSHFLQYTYLLRDSKTISLRAISHALKFIMEGKEDEKRIWNIIHHLISLHAMYTFPFRLASSLRIINPLTCAI